MSSERELKAHFAVKIKCCRLPNLASNIYYIHITKPTSRQRCSCQLVCKATLSAYQDNSMTFQPLNGYLTHYKYYTFGGFLTKPLQLHSTKWYTTVKVRVKLFLCKL